VQASFDVPKADAAGSTLVQRLRRNARAGVGHANRQPRGTAGLDAGDDADVTSVGARRHAVLHRVLHNWLQDQRRQTDEAQFRRHVEGHPESLFEARAFNVEIRFDHIELASQRRELSF
jgi:hypothetical protein